MRRALPPGHDGRTVPVAQRISAQEGQGTGIPHLNTAHAVISHLEILSGQQRLDLGEVEDSLEQMKMVFSGIDDLNHHRALILWAADLQDSIPADIHLWEGQTGLHSLDSQCVRIDGLREFLRSRTTVGGVIFDPEVLFRSAGVVRSSQDEAAERLAPGGTALTDDRTDCWSRQQAIPADNNA